MTKRKGRRHNIFYGVVVPVSAVVLSIVLLLVSADKFFGINESVLRKLFGISDFCHSADGYPLTVHFIDVGQGDSIFIDSGGKYILIDTGEFSSEKPVCRYLRKYGVKKIDLFIATHTDSDHVGDFVSVADSFEIENVMVSRYDMDKEEKTSGKELFYNTVKEHKTDIIIAEPGEYIFGDTVLRVLSPIKDYEDSNENSVVVRLSYRETSFLFMGDAGKKAEKDILSADEYVRSDVLKIGHHGSKTSTTQRFYDEVSPEYAVISASEYNKYLPNREVVERIDAKLFRTDKNGDIIIASDGKKISYFCQK